MIFMIITAHLFHVLHLGNRRNPTLLKKVVLQKLGDIHYLIARGTGVNLKLIVIISTILETVKNRTEDG